MTAQERHVSQQQESASALRTHHEGKSQLDPRQKPDEAGSLKTMARSLGNRAIGNLLVEGHQGSPLEPAFREQMERTLSADLSQVRVHDDPGAQACASEIDAEAFTRGEDVFLGRDARSLHAAANEQLLAHEVVHVVQQRKAGVTSDQVSQPGDTHEREADHASHQALKGQSASVGGGGAAPAVQRQVSGGSITKRVDVNTASRAEVKQAILEYLQRAQAAQGGSLHLNQAVRTALLTLSAASSPGQEADSGKVTRNIAMENLLNTGTRDPEELASRAAQILPDPFDPSALAKLQKMSVTDPEKSKVNRVTDLVKKNLKQPDAPAGQPPSPVKEQDEILNKIRAAQGIPQPKGIGPGSVDILGLGRIFRGLPGALKPKPPAPPGPSIPSADVEQAILKVPNDSLIPAEARGTPQEGEFAIAAQDVARSLAALIELAQKKGEDTVPLKFSDAYNHVKDRAAMIGAVVSLVKVIRAALPDQGAPVKYVDVYFGKLPVARNVGDAQP